MMSGENDKINIVDTHNHMKPGDGTNEVFAVNSSSFFPWIEIKQH